MENIQKFQEEIESYIKASKKNIFYCTDSNYSDLIPQIIWSNDAPWEDFFAIAEQEGISTFFEEIEKFDLNSFNHIKNNLSEDDNEDLVENICMNLEDNLDEIASITFSWFKNNIRYSLTKKSSWLIDVENDIDELKIGKMKTKKIKRQSREDWEIERQKLMNSDVPENLICEDENDLALQLLEANESQFPNYQYGINYYAEKSFFEPKGIVWHNPKHDAFRNGIIELALKLKDKKQKEKIPNYVEQCVEWAVENKISKPTQIALKELLEEDDDYDLSQKNFKILCEKINFELDKKQKEKIPNYVEQCVEWAVENKMYKPTQTAIKGFLAEEEIVLTPINFKILYSKVTMELNSIS
jgi:hypothetical protein